MGPIRRLVVIAIVLSLATAALSSTWYVDDDAPDDLGPGDPNLCDPLMDGSLDHPWDSIQKALDASQDGDVILLADGVYSNSGSLPGHEYGITVRKAVTLQSLNGPQDCVIDGAASEGWGGTYSSLVISAPQGVQIRGLTIQNCDYPAIQTFSELLIEHCIIQRSRHHGGAALAAHGGDVMLRNSIVRCNEASRTVPISKCSVLRAAPAADVKVVGCLVYGNSVQGEGALFEGNFSAVVNCTIVGNDTDEGYIFRTLFAPVLCTNTIRWGNTGRASAPADGHWPVSSHCWRSDPLFYDVRSPDPADWDLRLLPISPCIDAGTLSTPVPLPEFDLSGNPRLFEMHNDANDLTIVDIGAFETVETIPQPYIHASPNQLEFAAAASVDPSVVAKWVTLSNSGDQPVNWQAVEEVDWLSVAPASGVLECGQRERLWISVDAAGLPVGDYETAVQLTDPDALNSPYSVAIALSVVPAPQLSASPAEISLVTSPGDLRPEAVLEIENAGGLPLVWSAKTLVSCDWLTLQPSSGSLAPGGRSTVEIHADGCLPDPGTHSCTIVISSPDAVHSPKLVAVTLAVCGPYLRLSTDTVGARWNGEELRLLSAPPVLTNAGGGELTWSAECEPPCEWLRLVPAGGSIGACDSRQVDISVDPNGLPVLPAAFQISFHSNAQNDPGSLLVAVDPPGTFYVDDDAPNDPGPRDPNVCDPLMDGSAEHPFDSVQAAIDLALGGDRVVVAPGAYYEHINLLGKAITVEGSDPADSAIVESTILDGGETGIVVRAVSGETHRTVLRGLTIRNGYDPGVGTTDGGGGVRCWNAGLTVDRCVFRNNVAIRGGALYQQNTVSNDRRLVVSDCRFVANAAENRSGGALFVNGWCRASLVNCVFLDNHAGWGGAFAANEQSDLTALNCTVVGNTASERGGAVHCCRSSVMRLTNCILWANQAPEGSAGVLWSSVAPVPAQIHVAHSCVQGGPEAFYSVGEAPLDWLEGNLDVDPEFMDVTAMKPADWDLHLRPTSPCVEVGLNNPGNFFGPLPATDAEGRPRIVDYGGDGIGVVDQGAYETGNPTPEPWIYLTRSALALSVPEEGPQASDSVQLFNLGLSPFDWQISSDAAWLSVTPVSGALEWAESEALTIAVDPAGLAPGQYEATLQIAAPGAANGPITVPVTLRVIRPVLAVDPPAVQFRALQGGSMPAPAEVTITNIGEASVEWTADPGSASWLTVSPTEGKLGVGQSRQVALNIDSRGLALGGYETTLQIATSDTFPVAVPVFLHVTVSPFCWYVDDDAPNDPGPNDPNVCDPLMDGSAEHPFDMIQKAVNAAGLGDTILIADGWYDSAWGHLGHELGIEIDKDMTLRSLNGPENCIIDGRRRRRAFYVFESTVVWLEGLTLQNGAAPSSGGAVDCHKSRLSLRECVFRSNSAPRGAALGGYGAVASVESCRFLDSQPVDSPGGPAVACVQLGKGDLVNCTFAADRTAGAVFPGTVLALSEGSLVNCTIIGDTDPQIASLVVGPNGADVVNCIFYGRGGRVLQGPFRVSYSCGFGAPGPGNIEADPLFFDTSSPDPADWNLCLQPESPCLEAGSNDAVGPGLFPVDLEGLPRISDADGDGVSLVDMGAYEASRPGPAPRIHTTRSSIALYAVEGSLAVPRSFQLRNLGQQTLVWQASTSAEWLCVSACEGTLDSLQIETLVVTADATGLAVGEYHASVQIADNAAANSPVTIPVTLYVDGPALTLSTDLAAGALRFWFVNGSVYPAAREIAVGNTGVGVLHWTVDPEPLGEWLGVSNRSGSIPTRGSDVLVLTVDAEALPSLSQSCRLLFQSNGTTGPFSLPVTVTGPFSGGKGTPEAPYLLASPEDLVPEYSTVPYADAHFALACDIDASSLPIQQKPFLQTFSGTFDGRGHAIVGWRQEADSSQSGFFGACTGGNSRVLNFGLENAEFTINVPFDPFGPPLYELGLLAGYNDGLIRDCWVDGQVATVFECDSYDVTRCGNLESVGLLAGGNLGRVESCVAAGAIYDWCPRPVFIGGSFTDRGLLIGYNLGQVRDCSGRPLEDSNSLTVDLIGAPGDAERLADDTVVYRADLLADGWDLVGESDNGTADIWRLCGETGVPHLAWEHDRFGDFVCPDGTDVQDLALLAEQWLLATDPLDPEAYLPTDLTYDHATDLEDLAILAGYWLTLLE